MVLACTLVGGLIVYGFLVGMRIVAMVETASMGLTVAAAVLKALSGCLRPFMHSFLECVWGAAPYSTPLIQLPETAIVNFQHVATSSLAHRYALYMIGGSWPATLLFVVISRIYAACRATAGA